MLQDFSGRDLRGRSFRGQDLTGANFSYTDIRGTDFSGAILNGANFRYAKAGYRFAWLILVLAICLTVTALGLAYQFNDLRQLAASGNKPENELAEQLTIVLGSAIAIFGALLVSLTPSRNRQKNRMIQSSILENIRILKTREKLLLFFVILNLLGTYLLFVSSLKDLTNFFDGPWQQRGGSIFPPYFLSPYGNIFEFSYMFLPSILAGNGAWMLAKTSIASRKNILFAIFIAIVIGAICRSSWSAQTIYLTKELMVYAFMFILAIVSIVSFVFKLLDNVLGLLKVPGNCIDFFFKGLGYSIFMFIIAITGAIAMKLGKFVSLMPIAAFFLSLVIGYRINYDSVESLYDDRMSIISWGITTIIFLYSFLLAIATEKTSFREAELIDADFTDAMVQFADFKKAKFKRSRHDYLSSNLGKQII